MSGKTWVTADTHFGHANILNFKRRDGTPLRPFTSLDEMHSVMIKNWNDRVGDSDRVYLLGDIVMNPKWMHILGQLKGRLVLVKGNHDIFDLKDYTQYFDDIRAYVVGKMPQGKGSMYILSHIPVHPDSLTERGWVNIHGHLHYNQVMKDGRPDPSYKCVSVEHTDYAPVELSEILNGF